MISLLISLIYLAFVSLGLPDSLLGSAWPVMHVDLNAALSGAGVVAMIICLNTVISSLLSDRVVRKLGSGLVCAISTGLTAVSMLLFSFSNALWQLCLIAIPYGLGAGAIDACLNNYVALHLSSKHMNWLHCFWGLGATISPYIMGFALSGPSSWHGGYQIVGGIQIFLTAILFFSIPLWKKVQKQGEEETPQGKPLSISQVLRIPGSKYVFIAFFCYCAIEMIPMTYASSYFSNVFALESETAAFFGSLFYLGITLSRGICGFFSNKIGDKRLIRIGISIVLLGGVLITLPIPSFQVAFAGFVLVGFGCGPIYPSIIHSTPVNFGKENSSAMVGVQMACAYSGSTLSPIIFGKLSEWISIRILPFGIIFLAGMVFLMSELVNRVVSKRSQV